MLLHVTDSLCLSPYGVLRGVNSVALFEEGLYVPEVVGSLNLIDLHLSI